MKLMLAYRFPGDLALPRSEVLRRGIPEHLVLERTGPNALKLAFSQDNKTPWALSGTASRGYHLHDPSGVQAASFWFADDYSLPTLHWETWWLDQWCRERGFEGQITPQQMAEIKRDVTDRWDTFLRERVQFHLDNVDRLHLRKALDSYLETYAGAEPVSAVPGLRICPWEQAPIVWQQYYAWPELEWVFWQLQ